MQFKIYVHVCNSVIRNECHRDCVSGISAPVSGSHHSQDMSSVCGPGPAVRVCECNETTQTE